MSLWRPPAELWFERRESENQKWFTRKRWPSALQKKSKANSVFILWLTRMLKFPFRAKVKLLGSEREMIAEIKAKQQIRFCCCCRRRLCLSSLRWILRTAECAVCAEFFFLFCTAISPKPEISSQWYNTRKNSSNDNSHGTLFLFSRSQLMCNWAEMPFFNLLAADERLDLCAV